MVDFYNYIWQHDHEQVQLHVLWFCPLYKLPPTSQWKYCDIWTLLSLLGPYPNYCAAGIPTAIYNWSVGVWVCGGCGCRCGCGSYKYMIFHVHPCHPYTTALQSSDIPRCEYCQSNTTHWISKASYIASVRGDTSQLCS